MTNKLKTEEMTPDLIDRINALAIDQSLTLPDGRVITCRNDEGVDDHCLCGCALEDAYCCDVIDCGRKTDDGPVVVYYELTDAPQVDNLATIKTEAIHA